MPAVVLSAFVIVPIASSRNFLLTTGNQLSQMTIPSTVHPVHTYYTQYSAIIMKSGEDSGGGHSV